MTEPYLILHKVRGEPVFDIAHQMEMDDEIWWIVSTSGHRAYPYETMPLSKLRYDPTGWLILGDWLKWVKNSKMFDNIPDHYPINHFDLAIKPEPRHKRILERLGLVKPKGELRRI